MQRVQARGTSGGVALLLGVLLLSACESAADGDPAEPRSAGETTGASTGGTGEDGQTADGSGDPAEITLAFAGDIHFAGALATVPGRDGSTLGPMARTLREADLAVVNLETAITRRTEPARKELEAADNRFWFRTGPAALGVLDRSGVDVATVANNHGADYGVAGLRDTLAAGEDSPVALIGAGLDDEAAFTPYRETVDGTDVAVLAADASPLESVDPAWNARPGTGPGLATARDDAQLVAAVQAADAVDDLVVVYLHWGEEGASCPTGRQQALAASLRDAGADVVVGTHAHVLQGAGTLDPTYVSYGLGNFFWYHGRQAETGVLELTVRGDEVVSDTWVPGLIRPDGGNPQPLTGAAAAEAVAEWRGLRGCTDLAPGPGAGSAVPADSDSGDSGPGDSGSGDSALPAFETSVRRIGAELAEQLRGSSWRSGCPVPLSDLRHVSLSYVGLDGQAHRGVMVVNADVVGDVQQVFGGLYEERFPIAQMRLVDAFGADDNASMAANNTSAFNCRRVAGSTSYSAHAFGRAVDINPVQNPYVLGGRVLPPAGRDYVDVDRSAGAQVAPGVIRDGGVARRAFARLGWQWGGDYSEPDYQHFAKQ